MISDSERERLLSLPPPKRTNEILAIELAQRFLGYWTFPEPKKSGIEWGDTLMVFGDVCFIVEAKTRNKMGEAPNSWIRSAISDAISQINRKATALQNGVVDGLRNRWRGDMKWADLRIRDYYGICVLMHSSDPYEPRALAPSATSSAKFPTMVISLHDLLELLRFVSTAPDLIMYFELRACASRQYELKVHEEHSTFNLIRSRWAELVRKCQDPDVSDEELENQQTSQQEQFNAILDPGSASDDEREDLAARMLIDFALQTLMKRADPDAHGKRVGSKDHTFYVQCIEFLAEMSHLRRAMYGHAWLGSARRALKTSSLEWTDGRSSSRERSYLFVAAPTDEPLTDSQAEDLTRTLLRQRFDHGSTTAIALVGPAPSILAAHNFFTSQTRKAQTSTALKSVTLTVIGIAPK